MESDCDHEIEWDWGDVRLAQQNAVVPGWCPKCETEFERHYTHTNTAQKQ